MKMKSLVILATLSIAAQGIHLQSSDSNGDPLFLDEAINGHHEYT